jgi:glutaredoxin
MRTPELAALLITAVVSTHAAPLAAQYKWVGPGGTVTYSDLPPPAGQSGARLGEPPPRGEDPMPAALRQAATRYPVVLYTTADCAPCQQARAMLSKRGVPFAERTVATAQDAEAFRRAGFADNSLPAVSVGRERSVGFEQSAWERLLDAAGYPKTSMLPVAYKPQPAKSLAAIGIAKAAVGANDAGGVIASEPNAAKSEDELPESLRAQRARAEARAKAAAAAPSGPAVRF